jgi:LmbE family N-acetylglucosaminyl deacetylase
MLSLDLLRHPHCRRVLCLGAHSDDIEIGAGGTILSLLAANPAREITWVVFSGGGTPREQEARASAAAFLKGATSTTVLVERFRDGFFPRDATIKERFEALKRDLAPDLILTHYGRDHHQDHRAVSELTWNTWRDHLILEYEIPKYDGNEFAANTYVPIDDAVLHSKLDILMKSFPTQSGKGWFTPDTFRATMRLRAIECQSPTGWAEGFHARKVRIG